MEPKRLFDFMLSLAALILLSPLFIFISIWLKLDSKGPVFYHQTRVGRKKVCFQLIKFRTMYGGADRQGLLTVGDRDARITRAGYLLRKYKIDELPQLLNIIKGDMSFVGPRPEVSKYVALYDSIQQRVLSVRPGITDWASIEYINESELLAKATDPEDFYKSYIIPKKLQQGLKYIDHKSLWTDLEIMIMTLKCIIQKPH